MEIFKATKCRFTRTLYQTPSSQYLYAAHVTLVCKSNPHITPIEHIFLFKDDLNRMRGFAKLFSPSTLESEEVMYGRFSESNVVPYYIRRLDDIERNSDGIPIMHTKYCAFCLYYKNELNEFELSDGSVSEKYHRELGKSIIQAQYIGGKWCAPEKINPMPKYLTEELPLSGLLI